MSKYIHPGEKIEEELHAAIRINFKQYFGEENIHPQKVNIDYSQKSGHWSAGVSINFQSKPDFVTRTKHAVYRYLENRESRGMYWYCENGLIGDQFYEWILNDIRKTVVRDAVKGAGKFPGANPEWSVELRNGGHSFSCSKLIRIEHGCNSIKLRKEI